MVWNYITRRVGTQADLENLQGTTKLAMQQLYGMGHSSLGGARRTGWSTGKLNSMMTVLAGSDCFH